MNILLRFTNGLSFFVGLLMRVPLLWPLNLLFGSAFIRLFKIDMSEASAKLSSYHSLDAIFTRTLKFGARPVSGAVCSPADGVLSRLEKIQAGDVIQAKGHHYPAWELSGMPSANRLWDGGTYFTIYLAPHNYHRVHCPMDGELGKVEYIPGFLFPVNQLCVPRTPKLFVRNERLIFHLKTKNGGHCAVVMVGALNVGRMTTAQWPELSTNAFGAGKTLTLEPTRAIKAGDELGVFHLGSTVVVLIDEKAAHSLVLSNLAWGSSIKMGFPLVG